MGEANNDFNKLMGVYFEEAEDFIQNAVEALMRLEERFSEEDVNELFRAAHSLKGSSAAVDFGEVSGLTHKVEDMFDLIRTNKLQIDKRIIDISFQAFDMVGEVLEIKKNDLISLVPEEVVSNLEKIKSTISCITDQYNSTSVEADEKKLNICFDDIKVVTWKNTFYIFAVFDSEELSILGLSRFMLVNSIHEIGTMSYSNPNLEMINGLVVDEKHMDFECIIRTNVDKDEICKLLDSSHIKMIKAVDITREHLCKSEDKLKAKDRPFLEKFFKDMAVVAAKLFERAENGKDMLKFDKPFIETIDSLYPSYVKEMKLNINIKKQIELKDELAVFFECLNAYIDKNAKISKNTRALLQKMYLDVMRKMYLLVKNKMIFKYIKIKEKANFQKFMNFTRQINNENFKKIFVDISLLQILDIEEIKVMEEINKYSSEGGIQVHFINNGTRRRMIYNVLSSIDSVKDTVMLYSEVEAVMGFNWGAGRKLFEF